MADPRSKDEWMARFQQNSRVTGEGAETTQHIPCPFCAAPDFYVVPLLAAKTALAEDHTCASCGRSGRHEIVTERKGMTAEFVQTGGPDPAECLRPWPRRLDARLHVVPDA